MKALKVSSRFNLSTIFLVVMILFVTFAAYKFGAHLRPGPPELLFFEAIS
jgi:hypothetical protein